MLFTLNNAAVAFQACYTIHCLRAYVDGFVACYIIYITDLFGIYSGQCAHPKIMQELGPFYKALKCELDSGKPVFGLCHLTGWSYLGCESYISGGR